MASKKNEEKGSRKIAVYARKSKITESGKSVDNQISKCKSYANLKFDAQDEDIRVYYDEGLSGYYSDRPAYMQMLKDIDEGKIKAVICYKFDRISRRTTDLLNLVEHLKAKKISFVSCTDEVDTSSKTGRIVMSLLASIAEFERDIIAERIADNMYELAKEGRWLGGITPTGFSSKKEYLTRGGRKTSINHLEPIPEEQATVKEIFNRFIGYRSINKVVDWTRERGVKTKTGRAHTNISIRNILSNPVYAIADADTYTWLKAFDVHIYAGEADFDGVRGLMVYNKTEQTKERKDHSGAGGPSYVMRTERREIGKWVVSVGRHAGIVSGKMWTQAQGMLEANRDKYKRPHEQTHALLSGMIVCPVCGKNMYTHRESGRYTAGRPRFLYKCQVRRANKVACPYKDVKGNEIDRFVLDAICDMSKEDNDCYLRLMGNQAAQKEKSSGIERESRQLEGQIERISWEIEGQTKNLRLAPEALRAALMDDLEKLTEDLARLEQRRQELAEEQRLQSNNTHHLEKAQEIALSFQKLLDAISYQGKMELIQQAVEKVFVLREDSGDEAVHVFLKGTPEEEYADFFAMAQKGGLLCERDGSSICYPCATSLHPAGHFEQGF